MDPAPSPQEARAALAEASTQAERIRRAGTELRWMLVVIAGTYLVGAALVSTSPSPRRGSTLIGISLIALVALAITGIVLLGRRIRAYTRSGIVWFIVAIAIFLLWNWLVTGVSILSGWWGAQQPSYHFGVSEAVGVIPLLVAAWLIGRR